MGSELIVSTYANPLELRAEGDGRTVIGVCVPFDEPTDVGPYVEVFRRGAFTKTLQERGDRIPLFARHSDEALPLGRAMLLREDAKGLYGEFKISKTRDGDEALELVRDGVLHAFSIGFYPIRDGRADRTHRERLEVRLDHVGLVPNPAYETAKVLALRNEEPKGSSLSVVRNRLIAQGII